MSRRLIDDEQTRPGPLPQTRRPLALVGLLVLALIAGAAIDHVHSQVVLGSIVILISFTGFYTAARLTPARLQQQRYTRGPGWYLGVLIAKLPLFAARAVWLLISLGILALGVVSIASSS
jgi:hypothetical protein